MIKGILLSGVLLCLTSGLYADDFSITCPDGHLEATVHLEEGMLSYTVTNGERVLINKSPLGLKTSAIDLTSGLSFVSTSTTQVDDSYWLPVGKQSQYRDHCNTLSVVTSRGSWQMAVEFRLYDDGVAFRYLIPKTGTTGNTTIKRDASRVCISNFRNCWGQRFIGNYQSPNYPYEGRFEKFTSWANITANEDTRMNAPTLVSNGTDYFLLTEAANTSAFCSALIKAESAQGEFSFALTGQNKNYASDADHQVRCALPAYTPWRMIAIGSLANVYETTMAENLCPATAQADISWIRPGRAAWYWGGSDGNKSETRAEYGSQKEAERAYIDLAAEMGWEYSTIDEGWSSSWFPELTNYAKEKGIELFLWQNANLNYCQDFSVANMEATLKKWKSWGIRGMKIDFWEDDSQETMARMEKLLQVAAKYKMLVNLHGCTRPSGLRRTYPHLMTQEANYGGENNFWGPKNLTTQHHLALLFTRNVVGAMDFTPGDIARFFGPILTTTTMAQKLALLTLFESGIVHMTESPENLQGFIGRDIMKRIPAAWDETRLLEGNVDQYATVARRSGEDWWLAGISVSARTFRTTFDFLDEGKTYTAYIYRDGTCRSDVAFEKKEVKRGTALSFKGLAQGGFLIQISPNDDLDVPAKITTYEAESSNNTMTGSASKQSADSQHASGGYQVNNLGKGNKLQFNKVKAEADGQYLLTIYYITADDRRAQLLVNGEVAQENVLFSGNGCTYGTFNAEGMCWKKIPITLKAGNANTITIQTFSDQWAPNIDRITIQSLEQPGTAITDVREEAPMPHTPIYNLAGQQVSQPQKGIYIQNGKKFLK